MHENVQVMVFPSHDAVQTHDDASIILCVDTVYKYSRYIKGREGDGPMTRVDYHDTSLVNTN